MTALAPISEIERMANAACKSGLFPAIRSPEAAMTLMMLCQAEGLHPITALRRYHIIQGQPALRTDAMLGDFMAKGGKVEWLETTSENCRAMFSAPGLTKPVAVEWTMADAKRAGLADKSTWKQYPRQLLRARVISEGIRLAMPEVVAGIYSSEEVQDFDNKTSAEPNDKTKTILAKVIDAEVVTTNGHAEPEDEQGSDPTKSPKKSQPRSASANGGSKEPMTQQLQSSIEHVQLVKDILAEGKRLAFTEGQWQKLAGYYKIKGGPDKLTLDQAKHCLAELKKKTLAESIIKQISDATTEQHLDQISHVIKAGKEQLGDQEDGLTTAMLEKWGAVNREAS